MARVLTVLSLLLLVACGDSTGPGAESNISGTYTLRTINGQNLPFPVLVVGTTYRLEIASASLTINANGTYSDSGTLREIQGSTTLTQTENSTGTWTRTNNAIAFRDNADGSTHTGSLSGNTLTVILDGLTGVYQK